MLLQQSMGESQNEHHREEQRHDTNDTDIVRVDRADGIGDDDDNKGNTHTKDGDNKYVMKRIKELAKGNECHLLIGGIGAFFTGLIFPSWGVQFAYTIKLLYQTVDGPSQVEEGEYDDEYDEYFDDDKKSSTRVQKLTTGYPEASLASPSCMCHCSRTSYG